MIIIEGYTEDDKVPGAVAKNTWGAGSRSIGAIALVVTCMGTMNTGTGSATVDVDRVQIFDDDDAATYFGPRSELARMLYAALEIPGATIFGIAVAEAGGAAAATAGGVISGTWTESGEIRYQFDEKVVRIAIADDDLVDDVGANIVTALTEAQDGRLFFVPTYDAPTDTLTFTCDSKGTRGNQHTVFLDLSDAPSGFALTLTGGTALSNGGKPFASGSGSDDVTNALAALDPTTNDYLAAAHNDATNVALIETAVNAKAAFDVGILEQYHVSTNGNLTAATSLAQTTMNDQLGSMWWVQWGVEHPSRIAARAAALRSTIEGAQPNYNYDDVVLTGAAPQYRPADIPGRSTLKTALNAGVTPLVTDGGGLKIVRAICSRSLNGAVPDYRTLDLGDVSVPIRIRKEFVAEYSVMKAANPYAGPDVGDGAPPQGTFTPNLWNNRAYSLLKLWEGPDFNWVEQVDDYPPSSEWDTTAKRVMSLVDTIAKTQNHQIGIEVRQRAA